LQETTSPGYHLKLPLVTSFHQVQVSVQTDEVTNIPCGTSGGVLLHFGAIEVVNRLHPDSVLPTISKYSLNYDKIWIFDKIHHEINQFCSMHSLQEVYIDLFDTLDEQLAKALQRDCDKWETGIEIIAARVTKPKVPTQIMNNYEAMEGEKTKLLIEIERQKVIAKEAETASIKATIEAQMEQEVSKIKMEQELLEKQAHQEMQQVTDKLHLLTQKAATDARAYHAAVRAQANALRMTPAFIESETYKRVAQQDKSFYGNSLGDLLPLLQTPAN
jgi:regulator of protease activity HflC (stomatin/prohibitin superfamily)